MRTVSNELKAMIVFASFLRLKYLYGLHACSLVGIVGRKILHQYNSGLVQKDSLTFNVQGKPQMQIKLHFSLISFTSLFSVGCTGPVDCGLGLGLKSNHWVLKLVLWPGISVCLLDPRPRRVFPE